MKTNLIMKTSQFMAQYREAALNFGTPFCRGLTMMLLVMPIFLVGGETNDVNNGGFEEAEERLAKDMRELIKLGWDFNDGDAPFVEIPSYWNPNPSTGFGKMQLIKAKGLAYKGINCLLLEGGPFHVYQESITAAVTQYEYSFAAKGKGVIQISMYLYGSTPEGTVAHLGMAEAPKHEIDNDKWQIYEGKLEITNPDVKKASVVIKMLSGNIYLDELILAKVTSH